MTRQITIRMFGIISLVASLLILLAQVGQAGRGTGGKPGSESQTGAEGAVITAVLDELQARQEMILVAILFDTRVQNVRVSQDGLWAIAELAPVDPESGEVLPGEPGLALLQHKGGKWQVRLPQDSQWKAWLEELPAEVMPRNIKSDWLAVYDATINLRPSAPIGGYKLPWPFGQTRRVSQSTAHDRWRDDGMDHFAWDFYALSGGSVVMWDVIAARPGKVHLRKDIEPNGCDQTSGCSGNYIVLKDESTSPITYQLYLHLAQNSIPDDLQVGDLVSQGQFLGIADDTGFSTGHHLHFMVHTTSFSYWGTAVDITFDDVDINGGRPRAPVDKDYCDRPEDVCTDFRLDYASGNKPDPEPPTGDFSNITDGQVIATATPQIMGWGADVSSGFATAQLLVAARDGNWQVIGSPVSGSPFSFTPDLCQSGLPNGPTALGLRLKDLSGYVVDLKSLRYVTLDIACSALPVSTACLPGAGQATLFREANYQGSCKVFNQGGYAGGSSLSPLGGGTASSLLLGSGVRATLYSRENFTGRGETLIASDSNLADNRIRNDSVYSLFVRPLSEQPFGPQPFWPTSGQVISDTNSITLYWLINEGDMEYQVELTTPTGVITSSWLANPWWHLAETSQPLTAGNYGWWVRSRSVDEAPVVSIIPQYTNKIYLPLLAQAGEQNLNASLWSAPFYFMIADAPDRWDTPVTQQDFNDNYGKVIEVGGYNSKWTRTGEWRWENTAIPPRNPTTGEYFWYGNYDSNDVLQYASSHSGALTSPPIELATSLSYLRFWYYYETELRSGDVTRSNTRYWDQRWVQISVDNGPYVNLFQLYGEPGMEWQQSPAIQLPAFAGQNIRLRFYFDTIDGTSDGIAPDNYYQGWFVDDITISGSSQVACADSGEPNNIPSNAQLLTQAYQVISNARICPGDRDYYAFSATAGQRVAVDIDAQALDPTSSLDSVVELFDKDGTSVLANNDDYAGSRDSYFSYQLPRDGTYFLRVHSYYPSEGGESHFYNIKVAIDGVKPQVSWTAPTSYGWISTSLPTFTVQVVDNQSGVEKVELFWHDNNWNSLTWKSLGQASGSNGIYTLTIDPAAVFGFQDNLAIFALATDRAGNTAASTIWHLAMDLDLPTASLQALSPIQMTNTFWLGWSGADTRSGLGRFEIQRRVDSGDWQDVFANTLLTETWEVVEPGHTYTYRMRSVDKAGNASAYQVTSTVVPDAPTLCETVTDAYEPDNEILTAEPLPFGETQARSFCNPAKQDFVDTDWISMTVMTGKKYWLSTLALPGSPAEPVLALFDQDGNQSITPTLHYPANGPGGSASLFWISDRDGTLMVKIVNADLQVIGAKYQLLAFIELGKQFLPLVSR